MLSFRPFVSFILPPSMVLINVISLNTFFTLKTLNYYSSSAMTFLLDSRFVNLETCSTSPLGERPHSQMCENLTLSPFLDASCPFHGITPLSSWFHCPFRCLALKPCDHYYPYLSTPHQQISPILPLNDFSILPCDTSGRYFHCLM